MTRMLRFLSISCVLTLLVAGSMSTARAQQLADLAFAKDNLINHVCTNGGSGVFVCEDVSTAALNTQDVAAGDLNGDGFNDLVFANLTDDSTLCLNDGDGTFTCQTFVSGNARAVLVADINGDAVPDVVFANSMEQNRYCINDGGGSVGDFVCQGIPIATGNSYGVTAADLDGDADVDLAFANRGEVNRYCLNSGDAFPSWFCFSVSADANNTPGVTAEDINGDDVPDLVFANNGVNRLCINNGSASFACSDVSAASNNSLIGAAADIDGDDDVDLVFANYNTANRLCLNDGSATPGFSCQDVAADANPSRDISAADLDGDGDLDLAIANAQPANDRVCLLTSTDPVTYNCSDVSNDGDRSLGVVVAEFNEAALPVELAAFTVRLDDDRPLLVWQTASERRNAGFEVQHQQNGAWLTLGFVEGAGTSTEAQRYTFSAERVTPGVHRFRLGQIDFDGAVQYSPVVEVSVEMTERFTLAPAYPNPFNPQTTLRFAVAEAEPVRLVLYDALGKEVRVLYDAVATAGATQTVRLDASDLAGGVYFVRLTGAGISATQQLVLLK